MDRGRLRRDGLGSRTRLRLGRLPRVPDRGIDVGPQDQAVGARSRQPPQIDVVLPGQTAYERGDHGHGPLPTVHSAAHVTDRDRRGSEGGSRNGHRHRCRRRNGRGRGVGSDPLRPDAPAPGGRRAGPVPHEHVPGPTGRLIGGGPVAPGGRRVRRPHGDRQQRRTDREFGTLLAEARGHHTPVGAGDLHHRLGRLDLDDGLVDGDDIADLHQPADDLRLGEALTEVRQLEFEHLGHQLSASHCNRATASSTRSTPGRWCRSSMGGG